MTDHQPSDAHDQQQTTYRPPFRWGRAILIFLAVLIIALVAAYVWRGSSAEDALVAQAEQYRRLGQPIYPADFIQTPVPPEQNAVLDLRAAAAAIRFTDEQKRFFDHFEPGLSLTDKEMQTLGAILDANAEAIRLAHSATAKPGIDWGLSFTSPVVMVMLTDLNGQRQLANLLNASALHSHQKGDGTAAIERIEDMLFMSKAIDTQSLLISHLVALAIRAVAADCVMEVAPDLRADRKRVQALIRQLLDDQPSRTGLVRAMYGERMLQLDTVRCLVSGQINLAQVTGMAGGGGGAPTVALRLLKPFIYSDGLFMIRYMTQLADAAAEPNLPAAQAKMPDSNTIPRGPTNFTAAILLPAVSRAVSRHYMCETDVRAAATALAIRLYALDHNGQLPATLDQLVPNYLPTLPLDPLAAGNKPLGYIPARSDPILYSVGENAIDEQGSPTVLRPRNPNPGRWDTADAIYHLTRQPRKPLEQEEEDTSPDTNPADIPILDPPPPQ